jgi:hypothetical protein
MIPLVAGTLMLAGVGLLVAHAVHGPRLAGAHRRWVAVPCAEVPVNAATMGAFRDGTVTRYFDGVPRPIRAAAFCATASSIAFLPQPLLAAAMTGAASAPLGRAAQVMCFAASLIVGYGAAFGLDGAGYALLCRERRGARLRLLLVWWVAVLIGSVAFTVARGVLGDRYLSALGVMLAAPQLATTLQLLRLTKRYRRALNLV